MMITPTYRERTIAVNGAVRARLLSITFNLFTPAFVAGTGYSSALLDGLRSVFGGPVFEFDIGLDAICWREGVVDCPVDRRQSGSVVF